MKLVGAVLLFIGVAGSAMAYSVPEVDANTAGSALALVGGALMILGARRRRK